MLTCLFLLQTVYFCPRQSVSVTNSLCPPQKVFVCYRKFVSQTICIGQKQSVSVTDSLCLSHTGSLCHSQKGCVHHRESLFVSNILFLSPIVCARHRQSVSVKDSLCLSQTGCVCHRQAVLVYVQTLIKIVWPGFYVLIHDLYPEFSVRFELYRKSIPLIYSFWTPAHFQHHISVSLKNLVYSFK